MLHVYGIYIEEDCPHEDDETPRFIELEYRAQHDAILYPVGAEVLCNVKNFDQFTVKHCNFDLMTRDICVDFETELLSMADFEALDVKQFEEHGWTVLHDCRSDKATG